MRWQNVLTAFFIGSLGQERDDLLRPFGDPIEVKPTGVTRCAFQNINGMGKSFRPGEEICAVMHTHNIDIFGCAEMNCKLDMDMKNTLSSRLRTHFGHGNVVASSCQSTSGTNVRGGVATFVRGNVNGRIVSRGSDRMGRYNWVNLIGAGGEGISVVTAYRVCQRKGTHAGTRTAYMQQVRELIRSGELSPDPRERILVDLSSHIQEQRQKGFDSIVMLDANEDWEAQGDTKLAEFMQKNGLIDVHNANLSELPRTTYSRGRRRLDFTLMSERLTRRVARCGILSEFDGVNSDHTLQFIDFYDKVMFGNGEVKVPPPDGREFLYHHGPKRKAFIDKLTETMKHQQFDRRLGELEEKLRLQGGSAALEKEYNKLDYEYECAIRAAANYVGRKNFGFQRSPVLTEAGSNYLLWKSVLSIKQRRGTFNHRIHDLAKKAKVPIEECERATSLRARKEVRKAEAHLRECQKYDAILRVRALEKKAKDTADLEGEDAASVYKSMIKRATVQSMHKKLSAITKGTRKGLDYVEIPSHHWLYSQSTDELFHYDRGVFEAYSRKNRKGFFLHHTIKVPPKDSTPVRVSTVDEHIEIVTHLEEPLTWHKITQRNELEKVILQRNQRHLEQVAAEQGYPTMPSFSALLDSYGTGEGATKLLKATLTSELEAFPPPVQHVLRQLAQTEEERHLREITGTVSKKEFSAAFKVVPEKTSSSPSNINYTLWKCIASDDFLATIGARMMSIPFEYGLLNHRWKRCIEVMLEKKPGIRQIHLLRIIGILEADFNTALKIFFAKKLMQNAESTSLSDEQWGGRPHRTSNDAALRKRLTFDFARAMFLTVALFMMDATACFDRMVPAISAIIAQKYGMSKNILLARNKVIEAMQRHVRTAHGVSNEYYQQCLNALRMFGEVQGKGDVASVWAIESQIILKAHKSQCPGIDLPHADGRCSIKKNNDSYVDDTDNWAMSTELGLEAASDAVASLEVAAQTWAEILAATGGAIAFHKCKWQMLSWDFSDDIPALITNPAGRIQLKDRHGATASIEKLNVDQPNVGLGHRMAPNGNMKPEAAHRIQQCVKFATNVGPAALTQREAYTTLLTRILPTVTYPFPITQLSPKDLRKMNTIIDEFMLPKLRINRHTPKAIVYSPLELGGANYPRFETIQDQKAIMYLLRQLRWDKTMSNDILVTLSAIQLMTGHVDHLLEYPSQRTDYVDGGWLLHVQQRLKSLGGSLWIENAWQPTLQREHDSSIMSTISKLRGISCKQLKMVNYCRVYCRVITVSDLANSTGTSIPGTRLTGRWRAKSNLEWPNIPPPTGKAWKCFIKWLRKAYFSGSRVRLEKKPRVLDQPLGQWKSTSRHVLSEFYRNDTHAYARVGNEFQVYSRLFDTGLFEEAGTCEDLPSDTHPIEARIHEGILWPTSDYSPLIIQKPAETQFQSVQRQGITMTMSDGTVLPATGEAACYAISQRNGNRVEGGIQLDPSPYMTSYRSELEGAKLGVHLALQHEEQSSGDIHGLDNEGGVKVLSRGLWSPKHMTEAEADVLLAIQQMCKKHQYTPTWKHVKGHQGRNKPLTSLPEDAQLNEECDKEADKVRDGIKPAIPNQFPYEGSKAMLKIAGQWITTHYEDRIQRAIMSPLHRNYLARKWGWEPAQYDSVMWYNVGRARRKLTQADNVRVMKLMYNWLPLGKKNYDPYATTRCPCCGQDESTEHLFKCKSPAMIDARNTAYKVIEKKLFVSKIPSGVYIPFLRVLRALTGDTPFNTTYPLCPPLRRLIDGDPWWYDAFPRGILTHHWKDALLHFKVDKAEDKVTILLHSLWNIFFKAVWECRNDFLHKKVTLVSRESHSIVTEELRKFKRNSFEWLGSSLAFLTDYNMQDVLRWTLPAKQEMLSILLVAKRKKAEVQSGPLKGQRLLTDFLV